MVSALLRSLNVRIAGVHQAAYILALFTLFSQVLALVRDRLLAGTFGVGSTLDIYYAAFRVPDLVFVSVASLVSVSVIIPFLSEKIERNDHRQIAVFMYTVTTLFLFLITAVSVMLFIAFPYIQPLLFPGFSGEETAELVLLSRILLLSPILLGLSNIFGGINQAYRRFFIYALSPVLYNVGIIFGIVVWSGTYGIRGVVWGVVCGALLHMVLQAVFVFRSGVLGRVLPSFDWAEMWRVVKHSFPRTLALGTTHVVLLVLVAVASTLETGSIAVFNFAFNLQSVPMSIIGVSYSLAAFPTLSRLFASGKMQQYAESISTALRHIIFWSLPMIVLFVVLRAQIVRVILGSGEFDWTATRLTAAALAFFVLSVVFQNITLLLVRGYYAAGNTRIPLIVNVCSGVFVIVAAGILLALFRSQPVFAHFIESLLRIQNVPGTVVVMLPLAFALGALLNSILLGVLFFRTFRIQKRPIASALYHSFVTAVSMGIVAYGMLALLGSMFGVETFIGIFLQGALSGIVALAAGWFLLRVLDNQELSEIEQALKRKYKGFSAIFFTDRDILS